MRLTPAAFIAPSVLAIALAAGAAIGSAAIAAALLFVKRRKARQNEKPLHPEQAPETD